MATMKEFTTEDLKLHKSKTDLWVAIHGKGKLDNSL